MQKRLTEKLAILDAFLSKGKISQQEYEEQVQNLLNQSPTQNIGSWQLIQNISKNCFEARHRNRDLARMQGTRWVFVYKNPSREKMRQIAFFSHVKNPHLLSLQSYEIFGEFHLCSCEPFFASPIILPPNGLRIEIIQPWLEQLASLFDFLRAEEFPVGWLQLDDLRLTKDGNIFIRDLCREREPTLLQQHLLDTGVKQELIVWVQLALELLGTSKKHSEQGEIRDLEDMIATLTKGDGAGSIADHLESCMKLLEGLQHQRSSQTLSFDESEGRIIECTLGKIHSITIPFVFLEPPDGTAFWMSTQLISQDIFENICDSHANRNIGKNLPVDSVSRDQALNFCNQFSVQLGFEPLYVLRKSRNQRRSGTGVALPTLKQWRYACYKGKSQVGWHADNAQRCSQDVCTSTPNRFQIYDLLGNVWEWLEDGLDTTSGLIAGGSWRSYSIDLEGNPIKNISIKGANDVGFRIVVTCD